MDRNSKSWEIVNDYNKKAEHILNTMMDILLKAKRKAEDKKYRELIKKIEGK